MFRGVIVHSTRLFAVLSLKTNNRVSLLVTIVEGRRWKTSPGVGSNLLFCEPFGASRLLALLERRFCLS